MAKMKSVGEADPLDVVWGVSAIARVIGRTDQQVYSMIYKGVLPCVRKVGARYCAKRSALTALFEGDAA